MYHYVRALLTLAYITMRLPSERDTTQKARLKAVQRGIRDFTKGTFGRKHD